MIKDVVSAGILGVGVCLPEYVRKNDYWVNKPLIKVPHNGRDPFEGIQERRMFYEDQLPSDAEVEAGKEALKDAGVLPEEIDLVMVHSLVPDRLLPHDASLVQYKLGLKNAGAWNIDSCCSSFVTMVTIASNLIALKQFKKILIIASALNSKVIDESDYLCINLGDAAGAVVMGQVPDDKGFITSYCNSNGYFHDAFTFEERMPYYQQHRTHYDASPAKPLLTVNPSKVREIGKHSVENMTAVLNRVIEQANMQTNDIDFFLSHQPCHWAHDAWRDSIDLPKEKSYQTFYKFGNIASASIPVNLYEAKKKQLLKDGDHLLIASSGAGENHIAAILKWGI